MYRFISIYILLWFSRLKTLLGSGQFGEVYKATWSVNENQQTLELTVKTLKSGASEEDKVKFLQEAAIMGQFSHTNVINQDVWSGHYGRACESISYYRALTKSFPQKKCVS